MADLSVIDHFTDTFSRYIESGFGLLGGEVSFLSSTLVVLDVTLAGLAWAMRSDDVLQSLIKKVLYVGAFAFIVGNFRTLADIIFKSFLALGLKASGGSLSADQLMRPGIVASAGFTAAHPLLTELGELTGFPEVFVNLPTIVIILFCWILIVLSFFVLAVQLFVTLIEFKLTTLAGFVLVPFALWGKTAFLAERTLGNVVAAGVKVMVLAIVVGIGSTIFAELATALTQPIDIAQAMSLLLAAISLLGLGIFGPSIAAGLVSGAPQLGAGAAAATVAGAGAVTLAGTSLALGGLSRGAQASAAALRSAAYLGGAASASFDIGRRAAKDEGGSVTGQSVRAGLAAARERVEEGASTLVSAVSDHWQRGEDHVYRANEAAPGGSGVARTAASSADAPTADTAAPSAGEINLKGAAQVTVQALREGDKPAHSAGPKLNEAKHNED